MIPKITKGIYQCSTAHDSYLDIKSVLYFDNKDYCKVKALVVPRIDGCLFAGEEKYRWYKVPLENIKKWKRK